MDRFLLAENPMNSDGQPIAIIHTITPIAIIALYLDEAPKGDSKLYRAFEHHPSGSEKEIWTLKIHHLFTTNMAALDEVESEKMIDKLLTRAWHWYKSYLEWEDKNIDEDEQAQSN